MTLKRFRSKVTPKKLEKIYRWALEEHRRRVAEYNEVFGKDVKLPEGFEHFIKKVEHVRIPGHGSLRNAYFLFIPEGIYSDQYGEGHVVGMALAIFNDLKRNDRFHLFGFVGDSPEDVQLEAFLHTCRVGTMYGEEGAKFTLVNFFNRINPDIKNTTLFKVEPHLNDAIARAAQKKGIVLKGYHEDRKELLHYQLRHVIDRIVEFNRDFVEQVENEDAKKYELGLYVELESALTNLSGLLAMKNDTGGLEGLVEEIARPELVKYLKAVVEYSVEEGFVHNGYSRTLDLCLKALKKLEIDHEIGTYK